MRLAHWSTHPIHLPYPRAIQWGRAREDGADYLLLRLVGDDGTVGVAEGVAKLAWAGVTPHVLSVILEELFIPLLHDVDLLDQGAVTHALSPLREHHLARSMVDIACWDLRSQVAGKPLWQMWGGDAEVPVSWTVTRQAPSVMAKEAATMIERHGFRVLKVKGGQSREIDRAGLKEIRAAVGPEVAIYVDANRHYAENEGLDYVTELADLGVIMAEDPCQLRPNQAFRDFQEQSPLPLLVDNGCRGVADAGLFIEHGARALSIKLSSGGITESRRMADLAHENGVAAHMGFIGESSLGALVALQLAGALPGRENALPAETTFFLTFGNEYVSERVVVHDGKVRLPEQPGLDPWVDWERVAAFVP